jgi:hypothetical protein
MNRIEESVKHFTYINIPITRHVHAESRRIFSGLSRNTRVIRLCCNHIIQISEKITIASNVFSIYP